MPIVIASYTIKMDLIVNSLLHRCYVGNDLALGDGPFYLLEYWVDMAPKSINHGLFGLRANLSEHS